VSASTATKARFCRRRGMAVARIKGRDVHGEEETAQDPRGQFIARRGRDLLMSGPHATVAC
jgi:hypothetical protein